MAEQSGPVLLIQFAREPSVGGVKTRMMPHLSPVEACELHRELVLWTSRRLIESGLGEVELAVTGDVEHPLFRDCRALGVASVSQQRGADLGERMERAMRRGLQRCPRVVLVGSDCPAIDGDYLAAAVRGLDRSEVVLGPALDGGYVLIGARRLCREMFRDIPWGSGLVFARTVERLRDAGLAWCELSTLADVDRPEDLGHWERLRAGCG